ncbi:LOW QUALITY PROTEIN: chromosome partition protein Smc [Bacillus sp. JCM 19045]|nr:LOW QUALITY PROTEIN: chromosome partition protein Smc [Bacillus sp. JCM 19045]
MFLKRLEVKGFKSFAEPILIDFVPGVTAVVGPNGSGKSNIADAIRWVLGEQSAKSLRGAKMEDIIFAGSDSRKAVNVAEVSLILDNEDEHLAIDYSEVSVTRRLYRSGESEYLLNRMPCRLKDIVDLFLDSGLGREAYSIIGQGKIEEILSSKAEDRRTIFEEAAGVLKYKTRKQKAEKRLNQTEENLLRVADILNELEGQVEPLREQASIAKEFLALKQEQESLDIQVIAKEITDLHHDWQTESARLTTLKTKLGERQNQLNETEERLEQFRTEHAVVRQKTSEVQQLRLQVSEELEKNEGRRGVLEERQKNALQNEEQLTAAIAEKELQQNELAKQLKDVSVAHQKMQQEAELVNQSYQKIQDALNLSKEDRAEQIEHAKGDYIEWLNEQASLRNERRYLNEQLNQKQRSVERSETEKRALEQELAAFEKTNKVLEHQYNEVKEASMAMKQELKQQKEQEEAIKDRFFKQEAKLYEAYGVLQKITSRQEVLHEMEEEFAGFFQGVKEILKHRNQSLSGVIGAVAELMKVPKEIEKAIELALGAQAQHVVVSDEKAARGAIEFLKQRRLGRATFLPLTTIKPRQIPDAVVAKLANANGFIGVASAKLHVESTYRPIMEYLLGTTIIADTLAHANQLAQLANHRYRVVTLDGDIVNPGGSMTGGSHKQSQSSLLSRKREKEELVAKKEQLDHAISKLEQQVKQGKVDRETYKQTIEELEQKEALTRNELEEKQRLYQDQTLKYERMTQALSQATRQTSEQNAEGEKTKQRLSEIDQAEAQATSQAKRLESEIAQLEQQVQSQQESKEKLTVELTELKVKRAEVNQQLQYSHTKKAELSQLEAQLVKSLQTEREHFELLHSSSDEQAVTKDSLAKQITQGYTKKKQLADELEQLMKEDERLNNSYQRLETEMKQFQGEYAYTVDESQKLEVRVNRLDVDLDYRLNRLREEYELSYEAAAQHYPLSIEIEEAKGKLTLLKRSIDELGVVNVGAIDEYARVKERYDFLMAQKNDLSEARGSLDQAIAEMDEEMTKRFSETFAQIRSHFQAVFTKLFGGGDADLVLTNKADPLTTGIEIVARPPGKKRQQLALLSGGERALTAIALLFAILQVRPVPFCVLDEVEAALDEANVSRFAQYLRDFSLKTQFIVVTHRKGTMEGSDVLYGVTMEESGVSRLVSVKLEETRELIEN